MLNCCASHTLNDKVIIPHCPKGFRKCHNKARRRRRLLLAVVVVVGVVVVFVVVVIGKP